MTYQGHSWRNRRATSNVAPPQFSKLNSCGNMCAVAGAILAKFRIKKISFLFVCPLFTCGPHSGCQERLVSVSPGSVSNQKAFVLSHFLCKSFWSLLQKNISPASFFCRRYKLVSVNGMTNFCGFWCLSKDGMIGSTLEGGGPVAPATDGPFTTIWERK